MKIANCPTCGAGAIRTKYTMAPSTIGSTRFTYAPDVTVKCSQGCDGALRGSTLRDVTKAWNDRAKAMESSR